jgi:hypothetical protein
MSHRNKYLPLYIFLGGCFLLSIGFNILQYEENRVLQLDKKSYKTFYEYLYLKYLELQLDILDGKFDKNIT